MITLSYTLERFAVYSVVGYTMHDVYSNVVIPAIHGLKKHEHMILTCVYVSTCIIQFVLLNSAIYEMMSSLEKKREHMKSAMKTVQENPIVY